MAPRRRRIPWSSGRSAATPRPGAPRVATWASTLQHSLIGGQCKTLTCAAAHWSLAGVGGHSNSTLCRSKLSSRNDRNTIAVTVGDCRSDARRKRRPEPRAESNPGAPGARATQSQPRVRASALVALTLVGALDESFPTICLSTHVRASALVALTFCRFTSGRCGARRNTWCSTRAGPEP